MKITLAISAISAILFSGVVMADHHIGHTFMNLDKAEANLAKVQNSIIYMPDCANWTPLQLHFANTSMQKRLNRVHARIDDTREDLQTAQATYAMIQNTTGDVTALEAQLKGELFAARNHLTQPAWPNNGNENSAEFETGYLIVTGKYLVSDHNIGPDSTVCPEASKHVAAMMFNSAEALRFVNIAAWHVFDATNELV